MNKKQIGPIAIRVIKDRKPSYIGTNVRVHIDDWHFEKEMIKRKHPNSVRFNNVLKKLVSEITDRVLDAQGEDLQINARQLKEAFQSKQSPSFFNVADELIEKYKLGGSIGTAHKVKSIVTKIKGFANKDNLLFEEITVRFVTEYEMYVMKKFQNKRNTINKDLKFIKRVFNYAIQQDLIKEELNPFRKFALHYEPTNRGFLTVEEIEQIKKYRGSPLEEKCRDVSLFQYYSGGIRISDVLLLRWKNLESGRLNIAIKKTGKQLNHKLPESCLDILNKYEAFRESDDSLVFSFAKGLSVYASAEQIDSYVSCFTALINKHLKKIAAAVGVTKRVSTHIFRHSFAVNALKLGISMEVLKEMSWKNCL